MGVLAAHTIWRRTRCSNGKVRSFCQLRKPRRTLTSDVRGANGEDLRITLPRDNDWTI